MCPKDDIRQKAVNGMFWVYFFLWIIFNANLTWEVVIFGVIVASALLAFTCRFADYSLQKEGWIYRNLFRFLKYLILLIIEVVRSNMAVIHLILTQKEEPEPMLVSFETKLKKPATQALLANTITVTPGTITVLLEDGTYTVHCLDSVFSEGIEDSGFARLILEMEDSGSDETTGKTIEKTKEH